MLERHVVDNVNEIMIHRWILNHRWWMNVQVEAPISVASQYECFVRQTIDYQTVGRVAWRDCCRISLGIDIQCANSNEREREK